MPKIKYINDKRGMAVVEIQSNLCYVIEFNRAQELNIGDPVTGDLNTEGSMVMRNLNTMEDMDVIVQNAMIGESRAKERCDLVN